MDDLFGHPVIGGSWEGFVIENIACGLLKENGVKLLLLETRRDSFFGLSIGTSGGALAVVVVVCGSVNCKRSARHN